MIRLLFVPLLLVVLIMPAWAQRSNPQYAGYSSPYRQTTWNNITDKMHTMGQSPKQAELTKRKLHQKRTQTRINDINRAKRQAWLNAH